MTSSGPWIERRVSGRSSLETALQAALDEAMEPEERPTREFLQIEGMSGWRYRLLINALVRHAPNPRYLEVGVWKGSTFCSAIAGNEVRAVAVDDWSQFGGPKEEFLANVERFAGPEVRFVERDFRELDFDRQGRFNIYMFDGPHQESDQHDGISLALGALDDEFVLVVDDWNWSEVRSGTLRALASLGLDELFAIEVRTTRDDTHPPHSGFEAKVTEWHNGYYIAALRKSRLHHPGGGNRNGESKSVRSRLTSMPRRLRSRVAARAHARAPETTEAMVLVTHHHDRNRLPWLEQVIATIDSWPARCVTVVVVTNTSDRDDLDAIRQCVPTRSPGHSLEVVSATNLDHPHDLPWAQKAIIRDRFVNGDEGFTHLLSIEDDLAVPADAYRYWLRHRPLLPEGLIPSFVRVESRPDDDTLYVTDSPRTNRMAGRSLRRAGAFDFIALDKPYSAMFMMDRALAAEYVESPSFDQGASISVSPLRTRERAAMGLCWETPPDGFPVRHVVPVDPSTVSLVSCAFVRHLPGNYARDPDSPFAKVPTGSLLA